MKQIRIGTRSSPLALAQAHQCADRLRVSLPDIETIIVPISTTGDLVQGSLCNVGGKGLFSKELHEQLMHNSIDVAVHSLKDLETTQHATPEQSCIQYPEIQIAATWSEEVIHDVLVSKTVNPFCVATSSPRRADQWRLRHPQTDCVGIRGNVQTRLKKLTESEDIDGTIFADAGLRRLGLRESNGRLILPFQDLYVETLDWMIPAAGQGALAVDTCNPAMIKMLSAINDPICMKYRMAERLVLQRIGADCHTSIGLRADHRGIKWFYNKQTESEPWGPFWLDRALEKMSFNV